MSLKRGKPNRLFFSPVLPKDQGNIIMNAAQEILSNNSGDIKLIADLEYDRVGLKALTEIYNKIAELVGIKTIKKFTNKPKGFDKVNEAVAGLHKYIAEMSVEDDVADLDTKIIDALDNEAKITEETKKAEEKAAEPELPKEKPFTKQAAYRQLIDMKGVLGMSLSHLEEIKLGMSCPNFVDKTKAVRDVLRVSYIGKRPPIVQIIAKTCGCNRFLVIVDGDIENPVEANGFRAAVDIAEEKAKARVEAENKVKAEKVKK